ncbi:hypothetical protein CONPUDRAFT_158245 [Coniophora puteana RWD-64-598 SS2]|uniref:Cytochrome c oxidase assembly factor 3 n=1 Tax=Coniophora puteana (strain RWD-64-598) TaxID=741705 RepID=A0A5M3MAY6_CONPW|nr:uncharacterized protein CONPUDRAFT_158245 [Coniophora puteana RWD-64-598 SS2]EIW76217.1 hypothetical protein CONPUDRAFT_158245 [Coniophora puteana RWD-64-598 SS2]
MSSDRYVSRKEVNASYRPKSSLMSPGLQRARKPYRLPNAITGLTLLGFGVGVWAYSISAVKQDDFSDVDKQALELQKQLADDVEAARETGATAAMAAAELVPFPTEPTPKLQRTLAREGLLASAVDRRFPRLLDPDRKTFVWGAPPVDNIGRLWDRP